MQLIATLEILLFYFTAFGVRSVVQWRRIGKTGFVGVRRNAKPLERCALLLMLLALVLGPIAPWVGVAVWTCTGALGIVLAAAGIALTLVAQLQMGASWRIGVDPSERTELVTSGVFGVVRNPIFSAMLLASLGIALAVPTPLAFVVPVALLVALELQVRLVEEPYLLLTHGQHYQSWASRTGRFMPWFGRLRA